jgi:hypothetical protein
VLRRAWASAGEVGAAALGTLLIAVGLLINAASAESSSGSSVSSVVGAVGIGTWALVAISRAARRSLAEHEAAERGMPLPRQAALWLFAAAGLFVLAIGSGLTPDFISRGTGVAAGLTEAAGVTILLGTLAAARSQGSLPSRAGSVAFAGLVILVAAFSAAAFVSGVVFGADATLTGLRVGAAIVVAIEAIAVAVLGLAGWTRTHEITSEPSPITSSGGTSRPTAMGK